jgi:hypothetical protein
VSAPKSRRLPDTYNAEVVRVMLRTPRAIVNLEQFEFLKDMPEEYVAPRGSGYTKAVKREPRRYRGG